MWLDTVRLDTNSAHDLELPYDDAVVHISPMRQYSWTRYWHARGLAPELSEGGYLRDPSGRWGRALSPGMVTLDELEDEPCLVLLGEPGSGKTTELERAYSTAIARSRHDESAVMLVQLRDVEPGHALQDKMTDLPVFRSWLDGTHRLTLFIDSLDEGVLGLTTLAVRLAETIKGLPVGRLFLRLASRTADWPSVLDGALVRHQGDKEVRYLQLAPLREVDVEEAARVEGVADVGFFASEIVRKQAEPLAARPVSLRMLLTTYQARGSFPRRRSSLYRAGCLLLAREESETRKSSRRTGNLEPRERFAVAARIAFVLIFGNRSAVWTSSDYGNIPSSDVAVDSFLGGAETAGGVRVRLRAEHVHEVLGTALFSGRGANRLGFAHHTYAEYLASWYITAHAMGSAQVASLLLHPGRRDRRVVPQLRETTARLAELAPTIRTRLIEVDPEVLLSGDVSVASAGHKRALIDGLFREGRRRGVTIERRGRPNQLAGLAYPAIAEQIGPVIRNSIENAEVRRLAIDIAEACHVRATAADLASVALDATAPFLVRAKAAYAVARIGDSATRKQLKGLAVNAGLDDGYDQLKGIGLTAVWPEHITFAEVLPLLSPPQRSTYSGPYQAFLRDMPGKLGSNDLLPALEWARGHATAEGAVGAAVTGLLWRAWQDFYAPGVLDHFAAIAIQRLRHSDRIVEDEDEGDSYLVAGRASFVAELSADADRRRALFSALMSRLLEAGPARTTLLYGRYELVSITDAPWVLEQLRKDASDEQKGAWADVLWHLFLRSGFAPGLFDLVFETARGARPDPIMRNKYSAMFDTIELDSPEAQKLRADAARIAEWEKRPSKRSQAQPPTAQRVLQYLSAAESGNLDAWWHLCWYLGLDETGRTRDDVYIDITQRSGWELLDQAARFRMIDNAVAYLDACTAQPEEWLGRGVTDFRALAGYRALALLHIDAPDRVASLPVRTWESWASIVVAHPVYGDEEELSRTLIGRAYAVAPDDVLSTFGTLMEKEGETGTHLFALDRMDRCWDPRFGAFVLGKLSTKTMTLEATEQVLRELLTRHVDRAEEYAIGLMDHPSLLSDQPQNGPVLVAARLLLSIPTVAGRGVVWSAIHRQPQFGKTVFLSLAANRDSLIPDIGETWEEAEIADLYLWLFEHFPPGEDPGVPDGMFTPSARFNVAFWRNRLPEVLAARGSSASVEALERIYSQVPTPWHAASLRDAVVNMQRVTWQPPTVRALLEIVSNSSRRLVRDGGELRRVVNQSLRRFQDKLQGELPFVRFLWVPRGRSTWIPRDEGDLADAITTHLLDDLEKRGIVAGRELVIRRGAGDGFEGQRTDVYVFATIPGESEDDVRTASLVIEVKGSWHAEVLTAMKSQLLEDYLARNQRCHHGLYLVGWYASPLWDRRDRRRGSASRFDSADELAALLNDQARELTRAGGRSIRAKVLDVSLGNESG